MAALFKYLPAYSDVVPIPQDDGPNPVCSIAYSEMFSDAMDYFRALSRANEHSDRALEVTKQVIEMNPANYSVWHYRRQIIFGMGKDLAEELEYVSDQIESNPKNYQVWYHRRAIVEKMNDGSEELEFTSNIILESSGEKNYHAFAYRHWAIKTFGLFEGGLEFVDTLLASDVRNNSAWNHRFFLIDSSEGWTQEVVAREVGYAVQKLRLAFHNESGWNYLAGVCNQHTDGLLVSADVKAVALEGGDSAYACGVLLDVLTAEGQKDEAVDLCAKLASELDPIRKKYWMYRQNELKAQ